MEREKLERALTEILRHDNALLRDVSEHYVKGRQYAPPPRRIEYGYGSEERRNAHWWGEGGVERRQPARVQRSESNSKYNRDMGYLSDPAELSDPGDLSDF
jgi:hypothetical protein